MVRLSANISTMFTALPFLDRFDHAARLGFRGVEFHSPYEFPVGDVVHGMDAAGLEVVLFNSPAGSGEGGDGYASIPGFEREFLESIKRAVDYAGALRCTKVHVLAGSPPGDIAPEDALACFAANMARAEAVMARSRITAFVEMLNPIQNPHYFLRDFQFLKAVLGDERLKNASLLFDFYHLQMTHGNLVRHMDDVWPRIGHFQAANVPGRTDLGAGEIDYRYLFAEIGRRGYDGWVGCEYLQDASHGRLDWARDYGIEDVPADGRGS